MMADPIAWRARDALVDGVCELHGDSHGLPEPDEGAA